MPSPIPPNESIPLKFEEIVRILRARWGVTYEMKLIVRRKNLYFQIMWGYLEQQSFPMDEVEYRQKLGEYLEIINRLGQSRFVREWFGNLKSKPRLGRALSLPLRGVESLGEFVL